jgi:hypothetical protein
MPGVLGKKAKKPDDMQVAESAMYVIRPDKASSSFFSQKICWEVSNTVRDVWQCGPPLQAKSDLEHSPS